MFTSLVLGVGYFARQQFRAFQPSTPFRSEWLAVSQMDRHRSKISKQRARPHSGPATRSSDSRSEPNHSKSALDFPQREPRSARGDPLHPFVALVKTFNEFLFELDADGKFLSIWTSNEALLRERRAEFLGRRALEVLGEEIFHPFSKLFRRVIEQGAGEDIEFPVDFPSGRRWFQARVSAVGRGAGKSHSVCLLARDITQRRLAEEALRQQEALLMHAEQVTGTGCSEYDVRTGQRIWSRQLFRIYGFDPKDGVPSIETVLDMIHPDDRGRFRSDLLSAIESCAPFVAEARYNLPDGLQHIIFVRGITLPDESGKTARLLTVVQDVTELRRAETQARERESLLAQAEEIAKLGSWEMDIVHSTITCSAEFFRMLGLEPITGPIPVEDLWSMVRLEDIGAVKQALQPAIATRTPLEHLSRYIMPDGRTRVLHTRAIPFADASGQITRFVGFNHDITEQKRVEDDLRRLSRQLLTLRSEEQRRLARELHETASQTLTALKMTLKQIDDLLPADDKRARELAKSCRTLTADAIREVRTISSILHPPLMDEAGLTVGLSSYVRLFSERSGVAVNFAIPDDFQRLPKEVELTLFCIAQESLANVHRHSKARAVEISIVRTTRDVTLTVRDDGIGMALPSHSDRRNSLLGIGIAGMRERVNQLQGQFHVHSAPGEGTSIQVTLPLVPLVIEERSE